jgi:dihydroorotate dehydrogenase
MLAELRKLVGNSMILVGTGGIDSPESAWAKMAAGANLVQVYTGMIFEGAGLPRRIAKGLSQRLVAEDVSSITKIVGAEMEQWRKTALAHHQSGSGTGSGGKDS